MSVRMGVLALLVGGPGYGYQLRGEFEQRTGGSWPLNIGQVYTTLDRLERDGLVARGDADDDGHVVYTATDAGREAVAAGSASRCRRSADATSSRSSSPSR